MHDLNSLALSDLYELLATYTTNHTKLLSTGIYNDENLLSNKRLIQLIQEEIKKRNLESDSESDGFLDGLTPAIA